MRPFCLVIAVACGLSLAAPAAATAGSYQLPSLGTSIELTGGWVVESTADDDLLTLADPPATARIFRSTLQCADFIASATAALVYLGGAFFVAEPWQPANWLPLHWTYETGGPSIRYAFCRDVNIGAIGVHMTYDSSALGAGVPGEVLTAIEAALTQLGEPKINYDEAPAAIVAQLNAQVAKFKAERQAEAATTVPPTEVAAQESYPDYSGGGGTEAYTTPPPEEPARDDSSWYDRYSKREARSDGIRLLLDYGTAQIEGAAPDTEKPTRIGATLRIPPRYRRQYAQHGLVYAASVSVGALGGETIGDGQVAVGGALGEFDFQLVGLVVLGADRVVDQAPLPPVDSYYGGVGALLRFPLGGIGVGVETSLTLLKGSNGDESRIDASLVTGHFAPLTAVLGVRRHGWDDGSSTSVVLGVGF